MDDHLNSWSFGQPWAFAWKIESCYQAFNGIHQKRAHFSTATIECSKISGFIGFMYCEQNAKSCWKSDKKSDSFCLCQSISRRYFFYSGKIFHMMVIFQILRYGKNILGMQYSSDEIRKTQNKHLIIIFQNLICLYLVLNLKSISWFFGLYTGWLLIQKLLRVS